MLLLETVQVGGVGALQLLLLLLLGHLQAHLILRLRVHTSIHERWRSIRQTRHVALHARLRHALHLGAAATVHLLRRILQSLQTVRVVLQQHVVAGVCMLVHELMGRVGLGSSSLRRRGMRGKVLVLYGG